jgi:hypothetical protein
MGAAQANIDRNAKDLLAFMRLYKSGQVLIIFKAHAEPYEGSIVYCTGTALHIVDVRIS